jgi:Fe-S cluster biosynthesis and repair protein YggX
MENQQAQTTEGSKEIKIYKVKNSALFCVGYEGGGQLPSELDKKRWTSPKLAQEAIDAWRDAKRLRIEAEKKRLLNEAARQAEQDEIERIAKEEAEAELKQAAAEVATEKKPKNSKKAKVA